MIDNTSAYIDVCNKAGLPINKVPKKGDKIGLAYEMAMKEYNPHLYQNITAPDPTELPADVLDRHNRQAYWTTDVEALEAKGFTGTAANLRKEMEEGRRQIEENKFKEMKARNDARDKAIREKVPGLGSLPPLSPESIARARAEWGITGN